MLISVTSLRLSALIQDGSIAGKACQLRIVLESIQVTGFPEKAARRSSSDAFLL